MDTSIQYKICSKCIDPKPITCFRPRKGGRHGICNDCRNEYERERRTNRKHKRFDKYASNLRRARNDKAVRTATALMIDLVGGVEGFAVAWHEQWTAAAQRNPGGREAVNGLLALMRLLEACQLPPPDYSQFTDEELKHEMGRHLRQFLEENWEELGLGDSADEEEESVVTPAKG